MENNNTSWNKDFVKSFETVEAFTEWVSLNVKSISPDQIPAIYTGCGGVIPTKPKGKADQK